MTNCTQESFQFPVLKRRIVEANFQGGDITSDGGVLLLQQVDRRLGLSEAVARTLDDPRRQASIDHNSLSLLRQRVYALALGYEDLNDHETLRLDLAIQTALGRTEELASSPTLCRWENRADRETAGRMHEVIVEQFIASAIVKLTYVSILPILSCIGDRHDYDLPVSEAVSRQRCVLGTHDGYSLRRHAAAMPEV